ncbi:MAG: methyltransferase RsmF C-terminal domain-like protein, partial [Cytophagales bacterium]
ERIKLQLAEESDAFFEALDLKIPTSIRINKTKSCSSIANFELNSLEKVNWNDKGYYLPERPIFTLDPSFQAGAYYVQEASSMFLGQVLREILPKLDPTAKILDLCAAPGGKSTLILDEIPDSMLLVSNEVIKSRASTLVENITKWGKSNVVVTSNDPKEFKKLAHYFDVIVVDAPCSGEGMFRKDTKAIEEWSENNVDICVARQQRIIDEIMPALKPNGYLVYCTCTYSPKENEQNVARFTNDYSLKTIQIPSNNTSGILENTENDILSYHFYPHKTKGEGFFISCMQKGNEPDTDIDARTFKFEFLHKKQLPIVQKWVRNLENFDYIIWKEVITAIPIHHKYEIAYLCKNLFVLKKGVELGKLMGDDIIPSHELAMSEIANNDINSCQFSKEEALIYFKKGDVSGFPTIENLPNGWALAQYEGCNLGWIKKIGGRTNNYLPKELRILKDF